MRSQMSSVKRGFSAVLSRFKCALLFSVMSAFIGLSVALAQTGDVPVTSAISDYVDWTDPSTGDTQRIQMQVQSDGAGVYSTVVKKGNKLSVQSVIQGIGDWVLDTGLNVPSPSRKVFLDFSHPIAGSGPAGGNPTPPFTTALVEPRLTSQCSAYGINMLAMASGQTVACPIRIGFYYPIGTSNWYRIHMTPDSSAIFPYPETDDGDVTCSGVDATSQCNQWRIEPNGSKGGCLTPDCSVKQNVVKLVKVVTVRGKVTEVNQGDFYMTFSIGVTKP